MLNFAGNINVLKQGSGSRYDITKKRTTGFEQGALYSTSTQYSEFCDIQQCAPTCASGRWLPRFLSAARGAGRARRATPQKGRGHSRHSPPRPGEPRPRRAGPRRGEVDRRGPPPCEGTRGYAPQRGSKTAIFIHSNKHSNQILCYVDIVYQKRLWLAPKCSRSNN